MPTARIRIFAVTLLAAFFCYKPLLGVDVEVVVGLSAPDPADNAKPREVDTPFAVDFTSDGAMIIAEYDGGRLLRWTERDGVTVLAGAKENAYRDGVGKDARFNKLHNVAIAGDGRMFLSDHLNHAVRLYDPATGTVSSYAGNGSEGFDADEGSITDARFRQPICVSLTPDGERLLIADIGNRRIRAIELSNGKMRTLAGNGKKGVPEDGAMATASPLLDPRATAVAPDGSWYLLERNGHVLRRVRDGRIETVAGSGKAGLRDGAALQAQFNGPKHLDVAPDGRVYIADDNNDRVRVYDPKTESVATLETGPYRLKRPHGVKVRGNALYIADSFHHRILKCSLPIEP